MKSFRNFLLEKHLPSEVYHATGLDVIARILKTGEIMLSPSVGMDNRHDEDYYLSVSRTPHNSFRTNKPVMIMDGTAISQRYKVSPINYWSNTSRNNPNGAGSEAEERILSNNNTIPNGFIKEIHFMEEQKMYDPRYAAIANIFKDSKIPVYVYKARSAFKNLNKEKAALMSSDEVPQRDDQSKNDEKMLSKIESDYDAPMLQKKLLQIIKDIKQNLSNITQYDLDKWLSQSHGVVIDMSQSRDPDSRAVMKSYLQTLRRSPHKDLASLVKDVKSQYDWSY
jgi:hypothetical protein